jgi:hypothetical protein
MSNLVDRVVILMEASPEKADPFTSNFLFQTVHPYSDDGNEAEEVRLLKKYLARIMVDSKMISRLHESVSVYGRRRNKFKATPSTHFVAAIRDREGRIDE